MINDQWLMINDQWSIVNCQLSMVNDECCVELCINYYILTIIH